MNRTTLALLATLVLSPALQACEAEQQDRLVTLGTWKQATPPAEPRVQTVALTHPVSFPPRASAMPGAEKASLLDFLNRQNITSGTRVTVTPNAPDGTDAGLLADRMGEVRRILAARGLIVEMAPPLQGGNPNQVAVVAMKSQIVPINCPGYNAPIQLDHEGRPILNPGCANAIDLGLMLENPNDLSQGRALPPADAEGQSLSIQRYRTGQTYAPVTQGTTN
ncbi:CpaD family pilus assembly lipoprotein [Hypericibacter sp.]|uniref:CpaD family pilus assembly lipoprotein n=1 Tax=Hypericibacter sp. TaxID=2705401 RepID=UPI003D6D4854